MPADSPQRGHNEYFPILQKHLQQDQYELFACGADAPLADEVESFASDAGVRLPADFISFSVSQIGGLCVAVKEERWPRPTMWDVGPFWSMLYGLYVHGFARNIPEFMDIRIQTEKFRQRSGTEQITCPA